MYHWPSGSASAGLGWSSSSQRSRKCCWQALRSERLTCCHLAMNCWGVMRRPCGCVKTVPDWYRFYLVGVLVFNGCGKSAQREYWPWVGSSETGELWVVEWPSTSPNAPISVRVARAPAFWRKLHRAASLLRNPFEVDRDGAGPFFRVAAARQRWAALRNPFGIRERHRGRSLQDVATVARLLLERMTN